MGLYDIYRDELCDLIYRIPLENNGWQSFAKRLLQILNASYVHIQSIDFKYNVLTYSNGIGPLPVEHYAQAELNYLRFPIEADPRWAQFLNPARKGWYQCHHHISDDFVAQSALYQKILLTINLRYVATHELIWDEKICVFWSISTGQDQQPLSAEALNFLDSLMPHLKRVALVKPELYEFSLDNIVGYNLVDRLSQPIMLLALSGQIVHLNRAAENFLKRQSLIKMNRQHLIFPEEDQPRFAAQLYTLENMFRYQRDQLNPLKNIEFSIAQSHLKLNLSLLASEKEMSHFGIRPLVMLTIQECAFKSASQPMHLKHQFYLAHDDLKQQYKLTKRELELCDLFVNGMNLKKIEQEMQLTQHSIRTYLRNIFTKTQCSSQAELMHFLIGLSF